MVVKEKLNDVSLLDEVFDNSRIKENESLEKFESFLIVLNVEMLKGLENFFLIVK